jgi:hypothetical protein
METATMTPETAAAFVFETIAAAKQSMIQNGVACPQTIYAVCNKLSVMLGLELDTVADILLKD